MSVTLVIAQDLTLDLLTAAQGPVETAGVLLARLVATPSGNHRLLARTVHWVPEDAYLRRTSRELLVASAGYVPALAAAEDDGCVPIWLHTHPGNGSSPRPSARDAQVDRELADVFRLRADSDWYGAIVLAHDGARLAFDGHIESEHERLSIDRLWSVGRRFALIRNHRQVPPGHDAVFDRNIRAFGGGVQHVLGDLRVAVVGCGGTGSAVIEQLARLGLRQFSLFDPDTLADTNTTRVYGSSPADVGRAKVDVAADHVRRIAPDAQVAAFDAKVTSLGTALQLLDADLVFGCTDDNAGRLVLSRLATYCLTPVLDSGVLLTSDDAGGLTSIDARVTLVAPGCACLVCRGRIDTARAAAEMLTSEEHRRLEAEGYAPGLPGVEPAVVAYTTHVAAAAVGDLLERLVGFGPEPAPTEVLLRLHEREISANDASPRYRHYCHPDSGKMGLGRTEPFLEQTWPE